MKLKGKWRHLGGSVYESSKGVRIHTFGFIQLTNLEVIDAACHLTRFSIAIKLCGGNKKRSLMWLAEQLTEEIT